MTNLTNSKQDRSIAEIKSLLRRDAEAIVAPEERIRASRDRIMALLGGESLESIAEKDPKKAAAITAEISRIQSGVMIDQMLAEGSRGRFNEHGPVIIRDTERILAQVRSLAEANIEAVRTRVEERLRETGLFEAGRLPRLASESIPVRQEQRALMKCGYLGTGARGSYLAEIVDGRDVIGYRGLSAGAILGAHDAAEAALVEVTARATELKKAGNSR